MAIPQTLLRVMSFSGTGRMVRSVVRDSKCNRFSNADTSGAWGADRQSQFMERVKLFPSADLPWTNFPRVTQIVGVPRYVQI
jgi:hypothetical protein